MDYQRFALNAGVALGATVLIGTSVSAAAATLEQIGSISLDGVKGRIDHLTYDSKRHRLFVAALGNNTVEVIDTATGKRLKTIRGEAAPQGIQFLKDADTLVVATGEGGTVDFFDGNTLALTKSVHGYKDADNVRYDASRKQVVVGWGEGALTWFTAAGVAQASMPLTGHPESFQIQPAKRQIYVNVPGKDSVFKVDASGAKILGRWPIEKASANYPMCLAPDGSHIFVACRQPPQIIAYNSTNGSEVSRVETSGDADDLFYDATRKQLYESCGEGFIDVFQDDGHSHLQRINRIPTAHGARTSLYVDELKELFLAVPLRSKQPCEIRVFKIL